MKFDNLFNGTIRGKAYQCYLEGKSVEYTSKYCGVSEKMIQNYYSKFGSIKVTASENTFIRISQAKALEAELFNLISTNGSKKRIEELSILVPQFCV